MLLRRGFTVIEFIVASVLTLSLVATVSVSASTLQRSLNNNRFDTELALYAANVMETARALNCGTAVDPDVPVAAGVAPSTPTQRILKGCHDRLVVPALTDCNKATGSPGQENWIACFRTGGPESAPVEVSVTLRTSWRPAITAVAGTTGSVRDVAADPMDCSNITTTTAQPPAVLRTVTFEWFDTSRGTQESKVFSDLQSYPTNPDIYQGNSGAIIVLVSGAATKDVAIADSADRNARLVRHSVTCASGGAPSGRSVVWFPYLQPGSYLVSVDGVETPAVADAGLTTTVNR